MAKLGASMDENIVECLNISKKYGQDIIFEDFNLSIKKEKCLVIMGESGSGKSTLLNMVGLLDLPNSGQIKIFDEFNIIPFSKKAEILLRDKIGYLFQNFALVDNMTVFENLNLALRNLKSKKKSVLIENALKKVGLGGYEKKLVYQCSGGEQQRIAIARLLLKPCDLILCDEPTGSLDEVNKKIVLDLLYTLKKIGKTIVIVTHDADLLQLADEVCKIEKLKKD